MQIKECTDKISPGQILIEEKENIAVKLLLKRENLTAIDIGCRTGDFLFSLYHDFSFSELHGVEYESEAVSIANFIRDGNPKEYVKSCKSIYEIYKHLDFLQAEIPERRHQLNKSAFKNVFNFHFNSEAHHYLIDTTKMYDYIILSNILHFFEESNNLLRLALNKLNPGGLIYIKVNHVDFYSDKSRQKQFFTEERLASYVQKLNQIHFCKQMKEDKSGIISMTYFGAKPIN